MTGLLFSPPFFFLNKQKPTKTTTQNFLMFHLVNFSHQEATFCTEELEDHVFSI